MLDTLLGNPILMLVGGLLLKDQLDGKKGPQSAQAPQQAAPQLPSAQAYGTSQTVGAWAPGMPVAPEEQPRKPIGPVALDQGIPLATEEGVWRCTQDTDEGAARRFAVDLAQSGLPVAAGIVGYHAHLVRQAKVAIESQRRQQAPASAPQPQPSNASKAQAAQEFFDAQVKAAGIPPVGNGAVVQPPAQPPTFDPGVSSRAE